MFFLFVCDTILKLIAFFFSKFQILRTLTEVYKERLAEKKPFTAPEIARYMADVAKALRYMHALNIVHRDVKLDNVFVQKLIDGTMNIKLGDLVIFFFLKKIYKKNKFSIDF